MSKIAETNIFKTKITCIYMHGVGEEPSVSQRREINI